MLPSELYQQQIANNEIKDDALQEQTVKKFDVIYKNIIKGSSSGLFSRKSTPPKGMYLWGQVGIGKTHMMDLFYQCLPEGKKMRMHFYRFMQMVHQELKQQEGQKDPLRKIAQQQLKNIKVICFDEFIVDDIADAMILRNLFEELFRRGICLIATSNIAPDDLYKGGLQRDLFMLAIDLIKQNTEVLHLTSTMDYRQHHLDNAGIYFTPLGDESEKHMQEQFEHYAFGKETSTNPIELFKRTIPVKIKSSDVIWFDFKNICGVPRCQDDYLELVNCFDCIFVSNLPDLTKEKYHYARTFITLVDILYDANKRIVISAETPIDGIYTEGVCAFDFVRIKSRLVEMQSVDYFQ